MIIMNKDNMRIGFTTGSCATAAAKAATIMLLSGSEKNYISIMTPKGIPYEAKLVNVKHNVDSVCCGVVKDGGDDPDITSGMVIYATVSLMNNEGIVIDGGEGVGRITRPGLDQPVGNAAINSVPRSMIENAVKEVIATYDYEGGIKVIISVPGGDELALKTFNPRLGIEGGISIIGTSGIVEPMSNKAIIDTIKVEIRQQKSMGRDYIAVAPGNYGMDFMKSNYDFDLDKAVKSSNFIGDTIDMAVSEGIKGLVLIGHIGKLIKLSGGIMNTHSREADCRMELMATAALLAGMKSSEVSKILGCLTTDEAYEIVKKQNLEREFMKIVMDRIHYYLKKRAEDRIQIECIVFSNEYGLLGETKGAMDMLMEIKAWK